ncbi:MAG: LLM class flavin-dependent oxidoreductase [Flavobacterium sp.]|nr:LLM class flavin-dependent oxidoreductase [Candidatus Neoflavobacterium equi]
MKKYIPVSMLDLAIVTADSTIAETLQKTKANAQLCDELGFERFWLAEHHNMENVASSATSVLIGFIAGNTTRIRVGSGGIMLPNHAPLVIAEQFGTLESLYPGRIDLGLGRAPGTDGMTAMAIRPDFYEQSQKFPQNVTAIQKFFSDTNKYSKVRAFPGEGLEVPLWILGSSMDSASLAAAYGLPYAFAGHFAPKMMYEAFNFYRENFQPSSFLQEPKTMACVNAILGETDEEAAYLSTTMYQNFLNIVKNERKMMQPPVDSLEALMQEMHWPYVEDMTACSFVGSVETVLEDMKRFLAVTEVDEIMVTSQIYDQEKKQASIRMLKEVFDVINS